MVSLLRIAAEPTVDLGIRHIAAITFKNAVKRRWDPERDGERGAGRRLWAARAAQASGAGHAG